MAQDKKLNVSVDDSGVSKLRQSANDLARDMIRSSRAYSTSSKEVLKDIEEQIRLIEKRNKLEEESQRTSLSQKKASGAISESQYKEGAQQISASSREDKLQVELLRELIDTTKATAKEEIRENRQFVEKTIRRDEDVETLGPKGDPEQILKRTVQRGMLGEVGEAETEERNKFKDFGKSAGKGTNQVLSTAAGSQNEFMMAAAALAVIPFVGQGLSMMANRVIGSADQYGKSLGKTAALEGTSIDQEDRFAPAPGFVSRMGLSKAEALEKRAQYQKASALTSGGMDAYNMMAAERVYGIDTNMMTQLAGIQRYGQGAVINETGGSRIRGQSVTDVVEVLKEATDDNNAVLQELLSTYTNTANKILSVSGNINPGQIAEAVYSFQQTSGFEGRQLDRTFGGLTDINKSQNPVVKTLMARSFRNANPDATWFETRAAMENPMGTRENRKSIAGMFENLREMTGGGELYQNALLSVLGPLGWSASDILEMKPGALTKNLKTKVPFEKGKGLYEGLDDVVWKGEQSTKRLESMAGDAGKMTVDFIDKAIERLDKTLNNVFQRETEGGEPKVKLSQTDEETITRAVKKGVEEARPKNIQSYNPTNAPY